jgi:hypothetical protein
MIVFWDMAPCNFVEADWPFRREYCLHHQGEFFALCGRTARRQVHQELSCSVRKVLAASAPKRQPRAVTLPHLPSLIQDKIRPKNLLKRRGQVAMDLAQKSQVSRLQTSVTRRLNEQWIGALESLDSEDQSL